MLHWHDIIDVPLYAIEIPITYVLVIYPFTKPLNANIII